MERAFERVAAVQRNALEGGEAAAARPLCEEERLRQQTAPMTAKDAVQRILLSWKDKDYFRLLQLPAPEADELGRAVWDVPPAQVSKAYRSLSVLVHPDKNPGDDARQAFEYLNQAYRLLRDPGKLEEVLREATARAVAERERREARACMSERVALNAQRNVRVKELRKEEGQSFQAEILAQMKRRQEEAKRKRQARSTYSRQQEEQEEQQEAQEQQEGEGDRGHDDAAEDERHGRGSLKKRKKPVFI